MTGDRAWFVQELIAALQEQGELAPAAELGLPDAGGLPVASVVSSGAGDASERQHTGLFSAPQLPQPSLARADLAAAAYDQLQFDFPQVAEREAQALADVYRSFASSADSDGASVADFALTRTLVEGIAYLSDRSDGGARGSEATSMLAASVLLELARYCVEKRGSPKVRALLAKLVVPASTKRVDPAAQYSEQQRTAAVSAPENDTDELVEKYAAEEDPDDLSEVYEGGEPTNGLLQAHRSLASHRHVTDHGDSYESKLRFLASHTFSPSFAALSVDKWLEWGVDDSLCALIRLLVEAEADAPATTTQTRDTSGESAFFGADGEWTRYLYILRDRLLRFPASSQRGIRNLKDLAVHFHANQRPQRSLHKEVGAEEAVADNQQPHHAVYRVFAELVVSKEFQQRSSQRAQESLAAAIYGLLPLIVEELQLIAQSSSKQPGEPLDPRDNDLVAICLQLLHFLMLTAANARAMAERLHESGVLRTLLTLLPPSVKEADKATLADSTWFRPLLRLAGECALWHEGVAAFVSRVPRAAALLPSLPAMLPAEAAVLSFSFHQHQVGGQSNVWELFASPALFPPRCESFLDAMDKVSARHALEVAAG